MNWPLDIFDVGDFPVTSARGAQFQCVFANQLFPLKDVAKSNVNNILSFVDFGVGIVFPSLTHRGGSKAESINPTKVVSKTRMIPYNPTTAKPTAT